MKTRTYGQPFDSTLFSVAPSKMKGLLAVWVAQDPKLSTHMSAEEARAMGKRLIKIANKIEKDALK